jgi:N-methylhydantoinase A
VRVGVDTGGTFTDLVTADGQVAKVLSTPDDPVRAIRGAIEEATSPGVAARPDFLAHGTTVATNALLERRGAVVALVTTEGLADVIEIGRQDRPSLYRLCAPKPAPLVAPGDRFGARERTGPVGVIEPLADDAPGRIAAAVGDLGAESVAVCLLFSYVDSDHERRIAEAIRERLPDLHVSASHEVLPRFREYERSSTTVIDAYLSPLLGRYLGALAEAATTEGLPEPEIMRS